MDSPECAVCYSATANCTLVCKHAFCKDCVKEWYHKSDDPTCPMCRRAMYFKGMYKVAETWEKERNDKKNEDVFNEAFEAIFEEEEDSESESESDTESDVSWETWDGSQMDELDVATTTEEEVTSLDITELEIPINTPLWSPNTNYYSDFLLQEIKELQKDYQKAMEIGMDFDVYLENLEYVFIETVRYVWTEDDNIPKNLFVSKHKNMFRNKRFGKRIPSKNDMGFTVVVYVLC